jgi:hypothetical protein
VEIKQAPSASASAAEPDNESVGSVAPLEGLTSGSSSRVDYSVPVLDDIDMDHLSRLIPDSFEGSSQDAVLSFYRLVVLQAVDLGSAYRVSEESRAEIERKDFDLNHALQDCESSISSLEIQVKPLQEELNTFGESESVSTLLGLPLLFSVIHGARLFQAQVGNIEREKRGLKEDSAQRDCVFRFLVSCGYTE